MAYKPKYAAAKAAPRPSAPPVPEKNALAPRRKKGHLILFILLGIVLIPASCFFTAHLMGGIFTNVGRPKLAVISKTPDMQIVENFETNVSGQIRAVRNSVRPADLEDLPEALRPTEETLPPVRKQYWIEEGTLVAPEPNQSLFGRTSDREELTQVLKEAKWILDGQTTYFQPDQQLYEDSIVRYYLDDSIFAITWQEVHDGSV